jgi:hypothetical protein
MADLGPSPELDIYAERVIAGWRGIGAVVPRNTPDISAASSKGVASGDKCEAVGAPKRQRLPAKIPAYVPTADDCQSIPDCVTYRATGQTGPCKFMEDGCNTDD